MTDNQIVNGVLVERIKSVPVKSGEIAPKFIYHTHLVKWWDKRKECCDKEKIKR